MSDRRAASRLAPPGLNVEVYSGLGTLPCFNPDLDDSLPAPVVELGNRVAEPDALLIASPEYAHGVSGPMKNALDWLLGNCTTEDGMVQSTGIASQIRGTMASIQAFLAQGAGRSPGVA